MEFPIPLMTLTRSIVLDAQRAAVRAAEPAVEGTLSQGIQVMGLRQTRYVNKSGSSTY